MPAVLSSHSSSQPPLDGVNNEPNGKKEPKEWAAAAAGPRTREKRQTRKETRFRRERTPRNPVEAWGVKLVKESSDTPAPTNGSAVTGIGTRVDRVDDKREPGINGKGGKTTCGLHFCCCYACVGVCVCWSCAMLDGVGAKGKLQD